MNKVFVIISREFLSRIKKKSFIITTLLFPLMLAVLIILPIYLQSKTDRECTIYVLDDNDYFINKFQNTSKLHFQYPGESLSSLKKRCVAGECDAVLHILGGSQGNMANLYFHEEPPLSLKGNITEQMDKVMFDKTLVDSLHIDLKKFNVIKETSRCSVSTLQIDEAGHEQERMVELNRVVGLFCGIFIYFFIFMYANQVMRSAIEEKSNRIIEIIVSSVRPFQFMMGKIVGVAFVGIVQFVIQMALVVVLLFGVQVAAPKLFSENVAETTEVAAMNTDAFGAAETTISASQTDVFGDISSFYTFPFTTIMALFFFYFLFGYLVYASLYAAVGSATDNETDSAQLVLPISLPLIISLIVTTMQVSPDSALLRWLSVIPFTSPIAMMYRIPSGVPLWEVLLSVVLLVATFAFCVWIAGRVYRIGLLTYGKKVTWRDLAKWVREK